MHTQYRKQIEEFLSKYIEASGWVHHGFLENIIAGKDPRRNSNSIYIIQLETLRLPSREKSQQVTLARRMGTRKAIGISRRKNEKALSLSFRRTARFKISTCPVNKLFSTGTKRTSKTSNDVFFSSLFDEFFDDRELRHLFLLFFSSFIENRLRTSTKSNEQVRSAHFEDILYTQVCGST